MQIALRGVAEAFLDRDVIDIDRATPFTVEDMFRDLSAMDDDIERAFINRETGTVRSYARVLVDGKVAKLTDEISAESDVKVCAVWSCDG